MNIQDLENKLERIEDMLYEIRLKIAENESYNFV